MGLGKAQDLLGHIPVAQADRQLQQAFVEKADALEADGLRRGVLGIGGGRTLAPQEFAVEDEHGRLTGVGQESGVAGA